jgi:hypothetical protein
MRGVVSQYPHAQLVLIGEDTVSGEIQCYADEMKISLNGMNADSIVREVMRKLQQRA